MSARAEAGSLADRLPYWGWLDDDRTCLARSGELLSMGRLKPAVAEGAEPERIDRTLDLWQRMLSGLSPRTRLHFYALRRPLAPDSGRESERAGRPEAEIAQGGAAGDERARRRRDVAAVSRSRRRAFLERRVQRLDVYVAWCHDAGLRSSGREGTAGPLDRVVGRWRGRGRSRSSFYGDRIEEAAERMRAIVDAGRALVGAETPVEPLGASEASGVLSELINRPGTPWGGATGSGMNWRLALSELEAERSHLRLGGEPVVLYSLLSPPAGGFANMLRRLYSLDATLTVSLEWRPSGTQAARRRIRSAQRHYFSRRYSLMAHARETEGTAAAMVDSAAAAESGRLGDALIELEADGVGYGEAALTVALHGDLARTERLDGEVRRIFAAHDAKTIREGWGQLPVWFARLPAQPGRRPLRSVFASAGLVACMAPVFGPPQGSRRSRHLGRESLALLETPWRTPYRYDLFSGDVGHTLILGATGSGKSFLLNFLLVEALKYRPKTLILDLGGSYRWLTRFLGGRHLELTPGESEPAVALEPFSLPDSRRARQFLVGWVTRLLRLGGWEPKGGDANEIGDRIADLYALEPERRTLSALKRSLPAAMWPALGRFTGDGVWGAHFDNAPSDEGRMLLAGDWQVVDLAGAAEHADLCEAALSYLLERMRLEVEDPAHAARLKLMVVDEAWRYLADPGVLAYLAEAAKTWRKRNAALILATQSVEDVTRAEGAAALLESIPTKLFLANPELPDRAGETFRLGPAEVDRIRRLTPKREAYLRRPRESAVLRLNVDAESYWLYTSSPLDAERRARAVERLGLERALEELARAHPTAPRDAPPAEAAEGDPHAP